MTTIPMIGVTTKSAKLSGRMRTPTSVSEPKVAGTKTAAMRKMLTRARGATMAEMATATGWQPHSLRAFVSGLRKSGAAIAREPRKSGEQAYRLVNVLEAGADTSEASAAVADPGAATGEVA